MQLASPWLLLLLGVLPAIWWVARPLAPSLSRARVLVRCVIATLLVLGASGPEVRTGEAPVAVMFLLDRSDSVGFEARARAEARVEEMTAAMQPGDTAGLAVFGGEAVIERRPSAQTIVPAVSSSVNGGATDIGAALSLARATLAGRGQRRIVLFSDGRETQGSAATQAALAADDGVHIDVVMAEDTPSRDMPLVVTQVVAPADARVEEPFGVSVDASGPAGMRGVVTLARDGLPAVEADVVIGPTGTGRVGFPERRDGPGVYAYASSIRQAGEAAAAEVASVTAGAMVAVSGETSILYVGDDRQTLVPVLSAGGFRTSAVRAVDVPTSLAALSRHDAVVLDGVEAQQLSTAQATALVRFVEQSGGGLLLLGTAQSLDPGGFPQTPLGAVLPVDLRPRTGQRSPSLALVLLVDKTGSMADVSDGLRNIELARQAVIKVIDVLPAADSLGIIAFDAAAPVTVAPLGPSPDRRAIAERLRAVEPSGATLLAPAVEQAVTWLRGPAAAAAARRHILLISDGRTTPADAARVRRMLEDTDIEVSAVAIGKDADRQRLEQLARATGGRAIFPDDFRQLPLLVAREAVRASGGRTVDERFVVRASAHPVLAGLDRTTMPTLGGYTVSAVKPAAQAILGSHLDDPVLAAWQAGLGKVGVVTADLGAPTSASMRDWAGFAPLWRQVLRWLGRRTDDRALDVRMIDAGDGLDVHVDAHLADGTFLNRLLMRARVRLPDGGTRDVAVPQVAPGRYHTRIATSLVGPHAVSITATDGPGRAEYRTLRGVYRPDRERRHHGTDTRALARWAESTGGDVLGRDGNPFRTTRRAAYASVGAWCLMAALIVFVAEIIGTSDVWARLARRRWAWPWSRRGVGSEPAA